MKRIVKKGCFDHDTLTVRFGGEKSSPENIFTAQAIKVPAFTWTYKEREDAGGGAYYNNWETITKVVDNVYIILRDGNVIGWMIPYSPVHKIKSELRSLDEKCTWKEVIEFSKNTNPRPLGKSINT